jgi:hypothetical protein
MKMINNATYLGNVTKDDNEIDDKNVSSGG